MLPRNYRITVKNETGAVSGAVSVKIRRKKIGADGILAYDAEATVFTVASIAANTHNQASATAQDNSAASTFWQAFDWSISVVNGTAAGIYSVWLEISTDAGTTWPTGGAAPESESLDVVNCAASATEIRSGSY